MSSFLKRIGISLLAVSMAVSPLERALADTSIPKAIPVSEEEVQERPQTNPRILRALPVTEEEVLQDKIERGLIAKSMTQEEIAYHKGIIEREYGVLKTFSITPITGIFNGEPIQNAFYIDCSYANRPKKDNNASVIMPEKILYIFKSGIESEVRNITQELGYLKQTRFIPVESNQKKYAVLLERQYGQIFEHDREGFTSRFIGDLDAKTGYITEAVKHEKFHQDDAEKGIKPIPSEERILLLEMMGTNPLRALAFAYRWLEDPGKPNKTPDIYQRYDRVIADFESMMKENGKTVLTISIPEIRTFARDQLYQKYPNDAKEIQAKFLK